MSDDIISGATGQKYTAFKVPKPIGYWSMGWGKQPVEVKPNWWRRLTHKLFFGWTWHDGLEGL